VQLNTSHFSFLFAFVMWRTSDGGIAYGIAIFGAIALAFYVIGNGFRDDAPYMAALIMALVVLGYLRDRFKSR
jgi:hypothetical protein